MRFSLKTLLAITAFVALSIVALLYANAIWATVFTTTIFFLLLFAIVCAATCAIGERAFWLGAAVFGAGYFIFALFVERELHPEGENRVIIRSGDSWTSHAPHLVTTQLLLWADSRVERSLPSWRRPAALREFVTIGHSIFTVIAAVAGGWLASRNAKRRDMA
jgi:hypothetical protein